MDHALQPPVPITIGIIERFPAICDMSALGQADPAALPRIAAQTPIWGHGLSGLAIAGFPCINARPWGRDYHTRLERMHRVHGETVLPDLVGSLARALIDAVPTGTPSGRGPAERGEDP